MLRAGPLSSPAILARLERDFVNTWILHQDLAPIAEGSGDPHAAAVAGLVSREYLYPVDSLVLTSAGALLDHVCANDLGLDEGRYGRLLDAAPPAPSAQPASSGR